MTDVVLFLVLVVMCAVLFFVLRIYRLLQEMKSYDEREFEMARAVPVNERVDYGVPEQPEVKTAVTPSGMPDITDGDLGRIVAAVMQAQQQGGK